MRAAVCYEFGKPLVVEEVDLAPPQAGEVQVRLAATAICHSDVHLVRGDWGDWSGLPPIVAGHESAGTVEAVGPGVTLAKPGDRVMVALIRSCGRCFYCVTGAPHLCSGTFALASESRLRTKLGQPILQGIKTAGFAEQVVVHESQVVQMPPAMPLDRAALLACGVLTGVGAVFHTAAVEPGASVAVIGAGGVGLNSIQGAALAGANPIIAVDLLENKLEAALKFGATHTLLGSREDAAQAVRELTNGRGADYTLVTVGSARAVAQATALTRRGGTIVLVGMPQREARAPLPIADFVEDAQTVIGSKMGSARLHVDAPRLVDLYLGGRLKLDELITARFPLEQINEAIESMERGEALRNVIVFA
jgi:Zn-dependent alcohol dehydrogenase